MNAIPEEEFAAYRTAGFGAAADLGERPVLLVVDVTYGFTGSEGLTLEEAVAEYPTACGPASWEAMPRIAALIELFRSQGWPVVYTRVDPVAQRYAGGATKRRSKQPAPGQGDFPAAIAPREGEWVLPKTKASAFFQTPLSAYLTRERIDSVVICGVSTSGCVRASAVDSCSYGFNTLVIDDCCFDRSYFAHCSNLFDLKAKYAAVLSSEEFDELAGASAPRA